MAFLTEYRASDWKISKLDPSTSGKYVFDGMTYLQDGVGHCDNCGHPIKWLVDIHDAEDESKHFTVGDDCIEFLLAISGGLENPKELEAFRQAKKELLKFFNWMRKVGVDTKTMAGIVGFIDTTSSATMDTIRLCTTRLTDDGFVRVPWGKYGVDDRVLASPNFTVNDWLKFFPNLKKVLLSYKGGFKSYITAYSGPYHFESINQGSGSIGPRYYGCRSKVVEICKDTGLIDNPGDHAEVDIDTKLPELGLGKVTAIRGVDNNVYIFLADGRFYDTNMASYVSSRSSPATSINKGVVFSDSIAPLFPSECTVNLGSFLTASANVKSFVDVCSKPGDEIRAAIEGKIAEYNEEKRRREEEEAARRRAEEERKAREEEERKRAEEEQRLADERRAAERKTVFDSFTSDSTAIADGLVGHCIVGTWLEKYRDPLLGLFTKKVGEALAANPGAGSVTIDVGNCISNYKLLDRQILTLRSMNPAARMGYLNNIVNKQIREFGAQPATWKTNAGNAELSYKFTPVDIKDQAGGGTAVIGKTTITITPMVTESETRKIDTKMLNENTKVTLTIGQLKKLIKESADDESLFEHS